MVDFGMSKHCVHQLHRHNPLCVISNTLTKVPRKYQPLRLSMSTTRCETTSSSPSNIHILGCGSIGLLYASAIHNATYKQRKGMMMSANSCPVTLLMRPHHKPHLICKSDDAHAKTQHWFAPVTVHTSTKGNDGIASTTRCDIPVEIIDTKTDRTEDVVSQYVDPIQCILLCTKANDAVSALDSIWHRLQISSPTPTKVIILSNGALAIRRAIYEHFGDKQHRVQIELGTTTHGAYKTTVSPQSAANESDGNTRQYNITHAGEGSTHCTDKYFISLCKSVEWDGTVLSDLDMNVMLWKKLAVNCIINPLTAVHGVKNGQLLDIKHRGEDITVITRNLLEEVSRVAIMEMEQLFAEERRMHGTNIDAWLQSTREQLSVPSLEGFVFKVMSDTGDNVSSMLQDVNAKRNTEVRFLNGYVASLGKEKYGFHCPLNMEMCQLVEELKP